MAEGNGIQVCHSAVPMFWGVLVVRVLIFLVFVFGPLIFGNSISSLAGILRALSHIKLLQSLAARGLTKWAPKRGLLGLAQGLYGDTE